LERSRAALKSFALAIPLSGITTSSLLPFAFCRIAQSEALRGKTQSFALRNPAWEPRLKPAPGLRRLQIAVGDLSITGIQEALRAKTQSFALRNPAKARPRPADTLCPLDRRLAGSGPRWPER
jgi:hypothetical protein